MANRLYRKFLPASALQWTDIFFDLAKRSACVMIVHTKYAIGVT